MSRRLALVDPSGGSPSTPKMPAMITSSVTACMRSDRRNVSPSFQRSSSRWIVASIIASYCLMASPWNGGSRSLR